MCKICVLTEPISFQLVVMTEPIDMLFGLIIQVGPRYQVLDGGHDPTRGRANFGGKTYDSF